MELTKERQKETGAFYTPKIWADVAVQHYIKRIIPNLQDYVFWDMAAGEGALLDALPIECEKYATTLEREDLVLLREKGYECNQFDFLNGDINKLVNIRNTPNNKLVVFTNPPYIKLPASDKSYAKKSIKPTMQQPCFYIEYSKKLGLF